MIIQLYDTSHNRRMIKPKKSSGKKKKKSEIIADLKIGNESATADIFRIYLKKLLNKSLVAFLLNPFFILFNINSFCKTCYYTI